MAHNTFRLLWPLSYRRVCSSCYDAYSFPEVEVIHSTSAKATILKLERIFSTHGLPQIIRVTMAPRSLAQNSKHVCKKRVLNINAYNTAVAAGKFRG